MKKVALVLFAALMLTATGAFADTVFTLTYDGCSGGCGTPPFGTITITQVNATTVMVTENLAAGVQFVATGAGDAIGFDLSLAGGQTATISAISPVTFLQVGPDSFSAFGSFNYVINCECGPGGSNPNPGPLSFTVSVNTGTLSAANFVANAGGFYFASDVMGPTTNTGVVAAGAPTTPVPEPTSMALLGTGLFGMAGAIRRRFRK